MARIRTIKPEFFTSEDITSLTPLSRLFYIALWCEADREGRLNWKPGTFKLRYFPADKCDIVSMADELIAAGLVLVYEVDGKEYAEIPQFKVHQVINNRESESVIPARVRHASTTRESGVQGEGRGKERKGKEDATPDGFDTFWLAYPKKAAKADALKAWGKIRPDEQLQAKILGALAHQRRSVGWTKDNGQFVPNAATWLNGQRWNDILPTQAPMHGHDAGDDPRFKGAK